MVDVSNEIKRREEEEERRRKIRDAKLQELLHQRGISLATPQTTTSIQDNMFNQTQESSIISCLVNDTILSLYGISNSPLNPQDSMVKLLSICIIALITCTIFYLPLNHSAGSTLH